MLALLPNDQFARWLSDKADPRGEHCDIPPKSAWLNCAIRPPPLRRAASTTCTAAGETECFFAIRSGGAHALSQRFHQVHDVFAPRRSLGTIGLPDRF
jgi:hypothetical protein